MAGRLSRVRRAAFLVALLLSAAAYAYSLGGIIGTRSELQAVVNAQSVGRSAPVVYHPATGTQENCPDRPNVDRVEL